jgi:hypothetical protein
MVTMQELANAMEQVLTHASPWSDAQIRTARWVWIACEADGLPYHLIDLVIEQVHREMVYGRFPLIEEGK